MPDSDRDPPLVGVFAELYDAFLETTRETLLEHLEQRIGPAAEKAIALHGELDPAEAVRTGYLCGLMDTLQHLDAGRELIRQALEVLAERGN